MTPDAKPDRLRWWYTVVLLAVYLGTFHIWKPFPHADAALLGIIVACALAAGALEARRRGFFVNKYDGFFHGVVILDIVLEGVLVPVHIGNGHLWCALAFAMVISGYRIEAWREMKDRKQGSQKEAQAPASPTPLPDDKSEPTS